MDRGKIVAIITGIISILLAVANLVVVHILDFRGEMNPHLLLKSKYIK